MLFVGAIVAFAGPLVAVAQEPSTAERSESAPTSSAADAAASGDDVVALGAFNVKADRVEDFGFRVSDSTLTIIVIVPHLEPPFITEVLPNTAAAKAGLQPGDRILKSDGRSAASSFFSGGKWSKLMAAKNAEAASGKKAVTWTLEIQPRGEKATRTVTLTLPTPPPHWGSSV
jgi:hypothetical protein